MAAQSAFEDMPPSSGQTPPRQRALALLDEAHAVSVTRPQHMRRLAGEALAIAVALGDRLLEAQALLRGGNSITQCVDPWATWEATERARRIFLAHAQPGAAAACQVASARALYYMGHERQALACARAALQEAALPGWDRACAHVVLFYACGRLGRIAEAYGHLNDRALPLARVCGEPHLLARVVGLKGWLFARLLHSEQNPGMPLPALVEVPSLKPGRQGWAQVAALFDEAEALLPPGAVDWNLQVDRQYSLGLSRTRHAAQRAALQLAQAARAATSDDPAAAAWGYFCQAMVLHDAGDMQGALAALPPAMALAEQYRIVTMTRDLCYFESICFEATGRVDAALAALKRYMTLTLRGLAPGEPSAPSPLGGAGAVLPPEAGSVTSHRLRAPEPACVKRAMRVIEQHPEEPLSVARVAAACDVSRRTLDAAFQASRGTTLLGYLRGKQFEFAAEQLLHTSRQVRDIALAVGYRSPTMFAREFRKRLGMTPSQWRAMAAEGRDPPLGQ